MARAGRPGADGHQPIYRKGKSQPLLALPYALELNDSTTRSDGK
ncbi:hypothetical protein ACSV9I_03000 [Rhizobium sp. G187]